MESFGGAVLATAVKYLVRGSIDLEAIRRKKLMLKFACTP